MCGLAGFLDAAHRYGGEAYPSIVEAMCDRLAHRGPDDAAAWIDPSAGVALGFRRLAIIDLSAAGKQPMASRCGNYMMVYNGEIYNHRALRAELSATGAGPWRGHSDSEVLLEAIARWGLVATLKRLNGMFAIAVWDRGARRLWLARDRLGEKPMYYGSVGGVFMFASEPKALQVHPAWAGEIDRGALGLYLRYGYVPAPWSPFSGIRKLPPGCYVTIDAMGEIGPCLAYWSASDRAAAASPFHGGLEAATDMLQALVDEAVAMRMEADVPIGAFLSGGIDSSTVVAAMQRARPGDVRTFSIGFPDSEYDESRYADAVARHLATDHTRLEVSEAECLGVLPRVLSGLDEPFADASQIPTLVLCQLTRSRVTVGLSGDGGDELFGGYGRYAAAAAAWDRLSRTSSVRRAGARRLAAMLAGRQGRLQRRLRKMAAAWGHETAVSLYRDHLSRWRPDEGLILDLPARPTRFDDPLPSGSPSLEQSFMLLDAQTYLPDDLLVKIDRASMSVGLEARAPLLDHRIAEFAWSLPPELVVGRGPKLLLREALYRRVPRSLVDRPKHGFEPPIGHWLRQGLREWADDLLSIDRLRRHNLVVPSAVANRWNEHRGGRRNWTYPLWTVLMLEAWLDQLEAAPSRRAIVQPPLQVS